MGLIEDQKRLADQTVTIAALQQTITDLRIALKESENGPGPEVVTEYDTPQVRSEHEHVATPDSRIWVLLEYRDRVSKHEFRHETRHYGRNELLRHILNDDEFQALRARAVR